MRARELERMFAGPTFPLSLPVELQVTQRQIRLSLLESPVEA
ncbi:MAG: hypothetical protein ACETWG_03065 [Candidatus Neomarinimicrobiota bacterium]